MHDEINRFMTVVADGKAHTLVEIAKKAGLTYDQTQAIGQFFLNYGFAYLDGIAIRMDPAFAALAGSDVQDQNSSI
ncbi:MAG: hypothetical protein QXP36_12350 [Conexivisphaerales archaeon]